MRVVLDTDVVTAGLRSTTGASAALINQLIYQDRGTLLLSGTLLFEYEAVLSRPRHQAIHGLSEDKLDAFMDQLTLKAEPVEVHYSWRPQLKDPGDEMVLDTAVNGMANAIVTFNRKDYSFAPTRFGIEVLSPSEALRRLLQP